MNRTIVLLFLMATFSSLSAQTNEYDATAKAKPKKHANITIETFDGNKFKGRLVEIGNDFIVFDASRYNPPADLRLYYLRPVNDDYRIDLEYIKTVTISRGRSIGSQTLAGAGIGGGLSVITSLTFLSEDPVFDSFGEWVTGAVFLVSVGTIAGFFFGLVHPRKIPINGDYIEMQKLKNYYFKN